MKRLIETPAFEALLSDKPSSNAAGGFIDEIVNLCKRENSKSSLFRTLRYTRFRLQALQEASSLDRVEKKCVGAALCH